jgi:hypothetical protein
LAGRRWASAPLRRRPGHGPAELTWCIWRQEIAQGAGQGRHVKDAGIFTAIAVVSTASAAEATEQWAAGDVNKQVLGPQTPVDDPEVVEIGDGGGRSRAEPGDLIRRPVRSGGEVLAVDASKFELPTPVFELSTRGHLNHARVGGRGQDLGLGLEVPDPPRVVRLLDIGPSDR